MVRRLASMVRWFLQMAHRVARSLLPLSPMVRGPSFELYVGLIALGRLLFFTLSLIAVLPTNFVELLLL